MKDYLIKSLAFNNEVRAYAVRSTETVREAQVRHNTWVNASAALGRVITATVMIGAMQKGEAKITVKLEGDGPLGPIMADANAMGQVRGYVTNPHVQLERNAKGKIDVSGAVGKSGTLTVIKDLGLRDFFSGQVELVSGEIGEDFTYYFVSSEQTPSSVGLGVLVNPDHSVLAAGGFILQLMPNASEETIIQIENNLKQLTPVSQMIKEGLSPEEILSQVLGTDNVEIIEKIPVQFSCSCNRQRLESAMASLGKVELESILQEQGEAEVKCHFCNEVYIFNEKDLNEIIKSSI